MSRNVPTCDNWAITKIEVVDTSFMWTLKNVSRLKHVTDKISSPVFQGMKEPSKWAVILYPNGQTRNNQVDIFLSIMHKATNLITARFRFSILDYKGQIEHQTGWSQFRKFSKDKPTWGVYNVVDKSKLLNSATDRLSFDSLTIFCEIEINNGFSNDFGRNNLVQTQVYNMESQLVIDLHKLYKTSLYSDVELIVDRNSILVHKSILSARSLYFYKLIQNHTANKNGIYFIELDDFSYEIILEVINYIYTEKINNLQMHASSLLAAAEKYNLPDLKFTCESNLINGINVINVSSLLAIAVDYNADKLKEKAIDYIALHASQVTETAGYEYLKISKPNLIIEIFSSMKNQKRSSLSLFQEQNNKRIKF